MVNKELTAHLAELSKIEFKEDELLNMTNDMINIIELMDKVCDFDKSAKPYTLDYTDYKDLRKDERSNSYPTEKIINNSKNKKNNCFVVPKVV